MKIILSTVSAIFFTSNLALGWIIANPIDYTDQLHKADFVGIVEVVEVVEVVETGQKKVMPNHSVQFRELRLELKVLSTFKGHEETLTCCIYREATEEELLADGVAHDDLFEILLNLGTSETLHLFPARVSKGAQLLVYLRSAGTSYSPVTGDLDSSHSLFRIEPSNLVNTMDDNGNTQKKAELATPRKLPSD